MGHTHATHSFLPDRLATFLRRHPQVSIALEEHTSPEVVMAVARGEVEVVAESVAGADVELIPYRADRLVLIAPLDHPLANCSVTRLLEVLDYPFVMLHAGSAIHTFTMNAAAALGRHLEVRIQVRSLEAVCRVVSAGIGLDLVPGSFVGEGGAACPGQCRSCAGKMVNRSADKPSEIRRTISAGNRLVCQSFRVFMRV